MSTEAERQRHYDLLHHQKRAKEITAMKNPDFFARGLLAQSLRILAEPCLGSRSVDLSDADYLAKLDAFASESKAKP